MSYAQSHPIRIAPSILAADILHLGAEIERIATADYLHFDVMDGSFVPNLSFGLDTLARIHEATLLPIDTHLMVRNPDDVVAAYLNAGAHIVTFHWEAARHAHRIVTQIHAAGALAGIALNPATPVSLLRDMLGELDLVLIMTVDPGFGGQPLIERSYAKVAELAALCDELGVHPQIEVDGGIDMNTAGKIVAAGATTLVAGSAVFGADNPAKAITQLRLRAISPLLNA